MLTRFKNALYGPPTITEDTSPIRNDYDGREAVFGKRIRSALTRSSSFRESLLTGGSRNQQDIYSESAKNRNNDNNNHRRKNQSLDDSQYSYFVGGKANNDSQSCRPNKSPKFRYSRPEFLQLKADDEILVSADHQIRPIILPRDVSRLPWKSGYAECINAGKSMRNEDQAACYQDTVIRNSATVKSSTESEFINLESQLPWVYFGIFDGHAGTAVAVAAASQLHNIVGEKLRQVADLLIALEFEMDKDENSDQEYTDCELFTNDKEKTSEEDSSSKREANEGVKKAEQSGDKQAELSSSSKIEDTNEQKPDGSSVSSKKDSVLSKVEATNCTPLSTQQSRPAFREELNNISPDKRLPSMIDICRYNISIDSLVIGALESAFWEMDALIAKDKNEYKMPGGCTAIVSLFILGKLYVCNAGDSRAIVYKNDQVIPMSFDFTPLSERERILRLGLQRPEFLGSEFTHLEFVKRPTRKDLGKQMLYKDAYMSGWSMKTITYDDLKFPLVWGEGKRSRVLATIGVTRGFGDHELRAQCGTVLIKPFLTPEPEVKVLNLEYDETLMPEDVLIMGSDGLWDVTSNQEAADIVKSSFGVFLDNEESRSRYRYITAAQDLVIHSRGHATNWNDVWRTNDYKLASLDDIAVFVIPLKQYRDEYLEWKRSRLQAKSRVNSQRQTSADESKVD